MSNRCKTVAIGCMIWSLISGGVGLFAIYMMMVAAGSGAVAPFPREIIGFYVAVEILLLIMLVGILGRKSWAWTTLLLLLLGIPLLTIIGILGAHWALDFLPIALFFELIWLGPWIVLAVQIRQSPVGGS